MSLSRHALARCHVAPRDLRRYLRRSWPGQGSGELLWIV